MPGAYIVGKDLNILGGFLFYPDNPTPFQSILKLDLVTHQWAHTNIISPFLHGLPSCVVLTDKAIMIIGGHDPLDKYSQEESKSVFMFNGDEFMPLTDLPSQGQLRFPDSPLYAKTEVLLFSDDELLFTYNLNTSS